MINKPTTLDPELVIETYISDIKREYLPNDIFDSLSSNYINPTGEEPASLPNSVYMRLQAEADKGRTCKVPMVKDLSGSPTIGANGDQRMREEEIKTKYFRMEYTDLSHATTNQAYGVYARDKAPYKIFEYRTEGLARYFKQYFGKMRRQALLEIQSENLEDAPHFNSAGISYNWYIPNRTNAQQPSRAVYGFRGDTMVDWVDIVTASILAAGTGINAAVSVTYIQRLEEWARTIQFITPIDFGDGSDGYVLTLPTPQCRWLKHCVQSGNLGAIFTSVTAMAKEEKMAYPGLIGQIGGIKIVEDNRYPTLTTGGSASYGNANYNYTSDSGADYSLTAQYRGMGRADDGSSDPRDFTANGRQVGFLLGQAAICEWMPEGFHWEWEYQQYDKFFGSGIFCSVGIKRVSFDVGSGATATTHQQDGSAVCPFAAPPELRNYVAQTFE